MIRSLLVSFVLIVLAGIPNAQSQEPTATKHFIPAHPTPPVFSFSVQEGVELLLGLRPKPGNATPSEAIVTWRVTLKTPLGEIIGSAEVEASIGGLAAFDVAADEASRSQGTKTGIVQIVMNDEILGTVEARNGRVALRAEAERAAAGRNPRTGETVQIAASYIPAAGTISVFDFTTRATRSTSTFVNDVWGWTNPDTSP